MTFAGAPPAVTAARLSTSQSPFARAGRNAVLASRAQAAGRPWSNAYKPMAEALPLRPAIVGSPGTRVAVAAEERLTAAQAVDRVGAALRVAVVDNGHALSAAETRTLRLLAAVEQGHVMSASEPQSCEVSRRPRSSLRRRRAPPPPPPPREERASAREKAAGEAAAQRALEGSALLRAVSGGAARLSLSNARGKPAAVLALELCSSRGVAALRERLRTLGSDQAAAAERSAIEELLELCAAAAAASLGQSLLSQLATVAAAPPPCRPSTRCVLPSAPPASPSRRRRRRERLRRAAGASPAGGASRRRRIAANE